MEFEAECKSMNAPPGQQQQVTAALAGKRLDQIAALVFPEFSRARLQRWIRAGKLTVNNSTARPKDKPRVGDYLQLAVHRDVTSRAQNPGQLTVAEQARAAGSGGAHRANDAAGDQSEHNAGQPARAGGAPGPGEAAATNYATSDPLVAARWAAESIPLNIVHEDAALLVINKPAGLVVHPASGHAGGTLLNGLLQQHPSLREVPRAGIVHRLDKDTTGLLVVAKTLPAHHALVQQLQQRLMRREYEAIVHGVLTGGGTINAPIGRHPHQRQKQAVTAGGKQAITHYRVITRFRGHTHIAVQLETGRTHQIRVHAAHLKHPIVGDPSYGGRPRQAAGQSPQLSTALQHFRRQALHARRLSLTHPTTQEPITWQAPPPADFTALLSSLQQDLTKQT